MISPVPTATDRGAIVWLSFDPQSGHEQSGRRPALVFSPAAYNSTVGLALVCPITSRAKGYPFEVPLPPEIAVKGVVLSDQIKSLDWRARQAQVACQVPDGTLNDVVQKLRLLIDPRP